MLELLLELLHLSSIGLVLGFEALDLLLELPHFRVLRIGGQATWRPKENQRADDDQEGDLRTLHSDLRSHLTDLLEGSPGTSRVSVAALLEAHWLSHMTGKEGPQAFSE